MTLYATHAGWIEGYITTDEKNELICLSQRHTVSEKSAKIQQEILDENYSGFEHTVEQICQEAATKAHTVFTNKILSLRTKYADA